MTRFEQHCAALRQLYGPKFVPPTGDDFIAAFNNGQDCRIKVCTMDPFGSKHERWGYVSMTTGWQPCFVLMRRVGQRGSWDTLNPARDAVVDSRWLAVKNRREL